jgi:CBS domain-containing protein
MAASEFDEAYDDEPAEREPEGLRLAETLLGAHIRSLSPRPAVTLPPDATIDDAVHLMLDHGIGAVLVEENGRAVGIFTERDVMRRVMNTGIGGARPIRDVMTPNPETLGLDDGIAYALHRLIVGGFRHIPIVDDDGRPLAVLSQRDFVAFILAQLPERILNLPPDPRLEAHSPDGG